MSPPGEVGELWKTHSLAGGLTSQRDHPRPSAQGQRPRSSQLADEGILVLNFNASVREWAGIGAAECALLQLEFGTEGTTAVSPQDTNPQAFADFLAAPETAPEVVAEAQWVILAQFGDPTGWILDVADRWPSATPWARQALTAMLARGLFPEVQALVDQWAAIRELVEQDVAAPALEAALGADSSRLLQLVASSSDQDLGEALLRGSGADSPEVKSCVVGVVEQATREDWDACFVDADLPPLSTLRSIVEMRAQPELGTACVDALVDALAAECAGGNTGLLHDDVALLLGSLPGGVADTLGARAAQELAATGGVVPGAFFEKYGRALLAVPGFTRSPALRDNFVPDLLQHVDESDAHWVLELVRAPTSVFADSTDDQLMYVRAKAEERRDATGAPIFGDIASALLT